LSSDSSIYNKFIYTL